MNTARPDLDPQLRTLLSGMPLNARLTSEMLPELRRYPTPTVRELLADRAADHRETTVTAADGARLPLSIFTPTQAGDAGDAGARPCVYWLHGGGMIMGNRFSQIEIPLEWLDAFGVVVVSIDYRLAPESTGGTLVEDAYLGLVWIADHATELGIDPSRIVVAGTSAGGGLAAGVTLMARDRGKPAIVAQVLICPMLDHRDITTSSRQYSGDPGIWTRETNQFAWQSVLGEPTGEVSAYLSPALAADLSGLPTTYIDAGTAEVFRDEDVDYASRIWASGGQAELHVWAGGCHGFDALFPQIDLSIAARRARIDWLARTLAADSAARVAVPAISP
ncbi:alpha/beta hydrolase [Nocardia sp. NPDC005366]|uniref:alpha/beta hydrolase n=1 Tax=Nocardia sp. NPDC005366 TaxID=3156878 RepID=UPI0033B12492